LGLYGSTYIPKDKGRVQRHRNEIPMSAKHRELIRLLNRLLGKITRGLLVYGHSEVEPNKEEIGLDKVV
jgi:hypothetical protein